MTTTTNNTNSLKSQLEYAAYFTILVITYIICLPDSSKYRQMIIGNSITKSTVCNTINCNKVDIVGTVAGSVNTIIKSLEDGPKIECVDVQCDTKYQCKLECDSPDGTCGNEDSIENEALQQVISETEEAIDDLNFLDESTYTPSANSTNSTSVNATNSTNSTQYLYDYLNLNLNTTNSTIISNSTNSTSVQNLQNSYNSTQSDIQYIYKNVVEPLKNGTEFSTIIPSKSQNTTNSDASDEVDSDEEEQSVTLRGSKRVSGLKLRMNLKSLKTKVLGLFDHNVSTVDVSNNTNSTNSTNSTVTNSTNSTSTNNTPSDSILGWAWSSGVCRNFTNKDYYNTTGNSTNSTQSQLNNNQYCITYPIKPSTLNREVVVCNFQSVVEFKDYNKSKGEDFWVRFSRSESNSVKHVYTRTGTLGEWIKVGEL